jgi:hypothetical protein
MIVPDSSMAFHRVARVGIRYPAVMDGGSALTAPASPWVDPLCSAFPPRPGAGRLP